MSLLRIICQVCYRNGSHRFSRYQVMEKIVSQALQPGSHIENPDSAKMTASFELTGLVKGGLIRHNGKGEYEFISREAYELVRKKIGEA